MEPPSTEARYTEPEKLGLLGNPLPVLHDDARLRAAMVAEFRAAAKDAEDAVTEIKKKGAAVAVHSSRKALRRARAVLSLVGSALPKVERRAIKDALQAGRRGLSRSRDHAVAPETLTLLPLGVEEREAAEKILASAAQAMPPAAEVEELLRTAAKHAAAQVEALEAALPQTLAWDIVEDGVRSVYRAARSARRAAKRDTAAFHTWRRRMKELGYQLEIVGKYAAARVDQIHQEIEGVTATASSAVDMLMLREFVETFAEGVDKSRVKHLDVALHAALGDLAKAARKAGRDAFARSPAKFAKRLARAVKKDLAPPSPPEHDAGDESH